MLNLSNEKMQELKNACELYKDAQKKASYYKKEQDRYGKIIKSILGDNFDDEFYITEKQENGDKKVLHKIIFKKVISFIILKDKMESDGILDKYQDLTETHPLKLY